MESKILFVDDEENVLSGYKRALRKQFKIDTALGPEEGLRKFKENGPYAVVISDLKMPVMNGIEFLSRVKEIRPETVRIMLTGFADQQTAIDAVNEGHIFRFLTKPCPAEQLAKALEAALEQYKLVMAEKELLNSTLAGSVKVLTEILSLAAPDLFGRTLILKERMRMIAEELGLKNVWELELSAMLSRIGQIAVPPTVLLKAKSNRTLTAEEKEMISNIPAIGQKLISKIPRLENVAENILYQNKWYDGKGFPPEPIKEEQIPLGARILKILLDLDLLEEKGMGKKQALQTLASRRGAYDMKLLARIFKILVPDSMPTRLLDRPAMKISVNQLKPGQFLLSHIVTKDDMLLVSAGQTLTDALILRVTNWAKISGIKEPIFIEKTFEPVEI
ncbi:MAG: response regulator [Calditrichia bacterium]